MLERRFGFPFSVKLIGIISLIVLLSMSTVTAIATRFFAEDSRMSAEVNNLSLNRAVALQIESEITALFTGVLNLLDNLRADSSDAIRHDITVSNYFTRNPAVAWIGVPGEETVANRDFFSSNGIDERLVEDFLKTKEAEAARARRGIPFS